MSRLVVVSNRVIAADPEAARRAGGLAVALVAALRGQSALWFGWSGEVAEPFTGAVSRRRFGDIEIATLDLDRADYAEYYNGYANATLWPLFHLRTDLTNYNGAFAAGYRRANRRFAEALAPLLQPDDLVWVQDYHLIPLGEELRRLGVRNRIGFFLHIPWPSPQLFDTLPGGRELAQAMFAYDLVGMQTEECVAAFKAYVIAEAGGARQGDSLFAFGRSVCVEAFPIGLDVDDFLELARAPSAIQTYDRMAAHGAFRSLIVAVDRLDYSKGIEERLLGFELFLERSPALARKVQYLQIAPSSRETVEAYKDLRDRVLALSGRINAVWADIDHTPMRFVNHNYGRAELAGVYRAARVGLVTPLRDGMNLVAKEYVAAQDPADPGVLILSKFAGAARQMTEALIVNPYDREEGADALAQALAMPRAERLRRWEGLMDGVNRDDVVAWRERFVSVLTTASEAAASLAAPRQSGALRSVA